MIYYGLSSVTYFLIGITVTLMVIDIALLIAIKVMERKIEKMRMDDNERTRNH